LSRLALVQLVLFALIAAVVIPFGIVYVVGPQGFGGQILLHANMSDAFGLTKGTVVTYRGVQVGKVSEVELDAGTRTARVELSLNDNTEIPTDSVAKVTMGTAAGIQNVDIYPNTDHGPYLRDGDEIAMPADQQPVQMSQLMLQASGVLEGIDPQAISDIGTELGNSFNGLGPSLATMIDNGGTMSAQLNDQSAELAALLSRTSTLVDSMATQSDSFVRGMAAAKNFTEQLESNAPVLIYLTDHSPAALNSAQQLFDKYHNTFGAVLANLVTVARFLKVSPNWHPSSKAIAPTLPWLRPRGRSATTTPLGVRSAICLPPVRVWRCTVPPPTTSSNAEHRMLRVRTTSVCRTRPSRALRSDRPSSQIRFSSRPESTP
jgi:phospholipid/cholesterol/gamma-HCH transport system substrate-binding protein